MLLLVSANERPAVLNQQKATGINKSEAAYADIYGHYEVWQKDYINPYSVDILQNI